jgi:hypothetical protein
LAKRAVSLLCMTLLCLLLAGCNPPSGGTNQQPPGGPIGPPMPRTPLKVGRVDVDGYLVGGSNEYGLYGTFETPVPGLPWTYEALSGNMIAPSVAAKAHVERLAKVGPSMGGWGQPVVGRVTATLDCAENENDNRVVRMRVKSGARPASPQSADTSVAVPGGPITRRFDFHGKLSPASRTKYNARTGVGIFMIWDVGSPTDTPKYRALEIEALFDSSTRVTGDDGARLSTDKLLSMRDMVDATATLELRGPVLYASAIKLRDRPE